MGPMEETMAILHFENYSKSINALEEIEIMKATTSDHILNITNNSLNKILQPLRIGQGPAHDASLLVKAYT